MLCMIFICQKKIRKRWLLVFRHFISLWHRQVHRGFNNNPSCERDFAKFKQPSTSRKGTQPDHRRNARVGHFSEHVVVNYYHNRLLDYSGLTGLVKPSHPSIPPIPSSNRSIASSSRDRSAVRNFSDRQSESLRGFQKVSYIGEIPHIKYHSHIWRY